MRTLMLMTAVVLMSNFPLVAGAVTDSKREHISIGLDRAAEVASERAGGLSKVIDGKGVPVPEPASMLIFAMAALIARAAVRPRLVERTRPLPT